MSQTATITRTQIAGKRSRNIRDEPITWSNWYKHVNWLQTFILGTTPLIALYGIATTSLLPKTAIWTFIYYFATGTGITAGYHRLWAHRSYSASRPLQYILLFVASGAVQGSLRWWCRDHRAHHRYTDTDGDPYSAHKGLLYSHIGWMILKQNPNVIGKTDISDLNSDWLIKAQHKYYGLFALFCGFIFPTLVPGLGWGDWRGGFFYPAVLRLVMVHHATFCVNSLAHYLGDKPFDDKRTPRDHFITAVVTMGEGYHNFHHEFPQDYRNAIKFYQYDPTKWLIKFCSLIGLASNLKKFPENEIKKGQVFMQQKYLDAVKKTLDWGPAMDSLPVISFEDYQEKAKTNALLLVEGIVYDVSTFMDEHPGGRGVVKAGIGKDMTTAFNGGVYDHSNAARNLMTKYRVAVIAGGGEVEARKTK